MINVVFLVPYPDLQERIETLYHQYNFEKKMSYRGIVTSAEYLDQVYLGQDCDVLVARGFSAKLLKKRYPGIPVIEIPITGYDVLRAVDECYSLYKPQKMGFISSFNQPDDLGALPRLLCCELSTYSCISTDDVGAVLEQAIADGCEAVIGGKVVNNFANVRNIPSVVIKTGDEAIAQALNEAVRTVDILRAKREQAELFKTIIQCAQDGIIYVNTKNRITVANAAAKAQFSALTVPLQGSLVQDAFPFMTEYVERARTLGTPVSDHIHTVGNVTISISYEPVRANRSITGVVVKFQNITKIQQLETQIRKKLSHKGLSAKYCFKDIIHKSKMMEETIKTAERFAAVDSNILIVGETGTGKELMAQSIHNASRRKNGPFVAVNCAALPENLLESELFGYVEGAFTGSAKGGKTGLFELAHNGTLFLDEVSEIPIGFQGKLLRALQEREVRRVGDDKVISIDVRIIAATNKNLKRQIEKGLFRQDLLYRLDILKLYIPPLRKHREDITELFLYYQRRYGEKFGVAPRDISPKAVALLNSYVFPGNIRELRNIVEKISALCPEPRVISENEMYEALYSIDIEDELPHEEKNVPSPSLDMDAEKSMIEHVLTQTGGNRNETARRLGINRTTLWRKMTKYSIQFK